MMGNVVLKMDLYGIILENFSKLISHYLAISEYSGAAGYACIQLNDQPTHIFFIFSKHYREFRK